MKNASLMIIGSLLLCVTVGTLHAQPPRAGEREGYPRRGSESDRRGPGFEQMDLAPEDVAAIRELAEAHRGKMQEMINDYRESMEALQSLMRSEGSSERELVRAARRSTRMYDKVQTERIRHFVALREQIGHEKALAITMMWRDRMRGERRERAAHLDEPPRLRERPAMDENRPMRGRGPRPELSPKPEN